MSADLVRRWLADGRLDLPLPGRGQTARRWQQLAALAERDVTAGRLAEAHVDAVAILADLDGTPPAAGQLWGVWAAEAPDAVVTARDDGAATVLDGVKAWCSGATTCTHALLTARRPDGERGLYAVDLAATGVRPRPSSWRNAGMADSDTRAVELTAVPAVAVGPPGGYLERPGFWHGAAGVAACWLGAARAVAAPLYRRVALHGRPCDPHAEAHLGAVDAALAAADAVLEVAARHADAGSGGEDAEVMARRVRAVVEHAVEETIGRTGRALGPALLTSDADHARRVADLSIYVRQSHAERDLAALGRRVAR